MYENSTNQGHNGNTEEGLVGDLGDFPMGRGGAGRLKRRKGDYSRQGAYEVRAPALTCSPLCNPGSLDS